MTKPDWKSFPESILSAKAKVAFDAVKATGEAYDRAKRELTAIVRQDFDKPELLVGCSYAKFGKISLAYPTEGSQRDRPKTSLQQFLAGEAASGRQH